ncbi:DUF1456 family protein [Myroides marinus]|uniref:Uncharacterized protein n=1 Tax=Myroides marinus TaxID=703342 RepID=A0A1H6V0J4_9FLAO|nr:DUF1456 family protein [Myroides marinus]MDM1377822.1 DUF1456 family protein [Myroides marinus]MDM1384974.1 DUF1456 family protein [Myroides marinus]MDM1392306.1 DUF1456 family protein [Myroides marinus]SEI93762.1 Protein of unknown function [Myroides marinus]
MNNNDILKKLRVALQLRDDQIVEILELVDFRISKGEIGNFFRNAEHPKFVECGDQVLRNFLNGLVIHLRGTKEAPKNPLEVLAANKADVKPFKEQGADKKNKPNTKPVSKFKDNKAVDNKKKNTTKKTVTKSPLAGIKFNNGKKSK